MLCILVDCNSVSVYDIGFSGCFSYGVDEGPWIGSLFCGMPIWKGDNNCDDENNNGGCEWDGGDCCGDNVNTQFCSACECLDPDANPGNLYWSIK